jgi:hypothetical protein
MKLRHLTSDSAPTRHLSSFAKQKNFTVRKMGGKILDKSKKMSLGNGFKEKRRETIAKNNYIGFGTVTNIIKDATLQEEYHDMELFRHLAVMLLKRG